MEAHRKPLESRLGRERCVGFMYMGGINGINLYKHGITHTYLNYVEYRKSQSKRPGPDFMSPSGSQ